MMTFTSKQSVPQRRHCYALLASILLTAVTALGQSGDWVRIQSNLPSKPKFHLLSTGPNGIVAADVEDLANQDNNGIYVSTDNGSSWARAAGTIGTGGAYPRAESMVIGNGYIIVGRTGGTETTTTIIRSSNNGASWNQVQGLRLEGIVAALASGPGDVIYASDIIRGDLNNNPGIYRSEDAGVNWNVMSETGLPIGFRILDLATSDDHLFGALEAAGIYRSTLNGGDWQLSLTTDSLIMDLFRRGNTILGAVLHTNIGAIHRSTNGGASWVSQNLDTFLTSFVDGGNALLLGGHAADGSGPLLFQSDDDGVTWNPAPVTGLPFLQVDQLAVAGGFLYAGTSHSTDAGLFRRSLVNGRIPLPPTIRQQPISRTVTEGSSVTFTVVPAGDQPFTYRWFKNDDEISSAASASYTVDTVDADDAGVYRVIVFNAVGEKISNGATLTVLADHPGTIDPSFDAGAIGIFDGPQFSSGSIGALSVTLAGDIAIGGVFNQVDTVTRGGFGRLHPDGTVNSAFGSGVGVQNSQQQQVRTVSFQPDGKLLVGGSFTSINGESVLRLGRVHEDGSIDAEFSSPLAGSSVVNDLQLLPNGEILIGGDFVVTSLRRRVALLNADGTPNPSFHLPTIFNAQVWTLAIQSDGKIIVGGDFNNRLARLHANGDVDAGFAIDTGANASIRSVVVQPDGKILVAGDFTSFAGNAFNRIVRLQPDGQIDASFNPGSGANAIIRRVVVQANRKILVGGDFTQFGAATSRQYLTRLNVNGTVDVDFNIGTGMDAPVTALDLQPDGNILVGKQFTAAADSPPDLLVRLIGEPAPPSFVRQPAATTPFIGEPLSLSVLATGLSPLTYQWKKNGVEMDGATGPVLDFGPAELSDTGSYTVVVSNSVDTIESQPAVVTVLARLFITQQPVSVDVTLGATITMEVVVGGDGPFTYQWQKNEQDIDGATDSILVLTDANLSDAGEYLVVVRNVTSMVTSDTVVVHVNFVLTANFVGFGAVIATTGSHAPGTLVPVRAEPAPRYEFVEWQGDVPEADRKTADVTLLMDRDRHLTARFGIALPVSWLTQYGLTNSDADSNADTDSLTNREEFEAGTNPKSVDDAIFSLPAIKSGWNLVALPIQPASASNFATFFDVPEPIFVRWWDGWSKQVRNDGSIVAKRGYWIHATTAIADTIPGHTIVDPSVRLFAGWNLIGWGGTTSHSVFGDADVVGTMWRWDADKRRFSANADGNLLPGVGYWVYASSNSAVLE